MKKNKTVIMNKILILLLISISSISCSNKLNEMSGIVWKGELTMKNGLKDNVILKISDNNMHVFSNVIFGNQRDTLKIINDKKNTLTLISSNKDTINLEYKLLKENNLKKLEFVGNNYKIELKETNSKMIDESLLSFYKNINVPKNSYMYLDGVFKGEIHRKNDDIKLSEVKFKINSDTLFIFSNAIFGAKNDTLIRKDFNENIVSFRYENKDEDFFDLKLKLDPSNNKIIFMAEDFYINFNSYDKNIFTKKELAFYSNSYVPRNAYMYLTGAYEGEVRQEDAYADFVLQNSPGSETVIKIIFLDNKKLKFHMKSFMASLFGASKPTIMNYKIKGNYLIINKMKFKIVKYGTKLVFQSDDENIVLNKIY